MSLQVLIRILNIRVGLDRGKILSTLVRLPVDVLWNRDASFVGDQSPLSDQSTAGARLDRSTKPRYVCSILGVFAPSRLLGDGVLQLVRTGGACGIRATTLDRRGVDDSGRTSDIVYNLNNTIWGYLDICHVYRVLSHGVNEYRGEFFEGDNADLYVWRTLDPADVVEGEIPCDVTPGSTLEDFRVDYHRELDGGAVAVSWLSSPDA